MLEMILSGLGAVTSGGILGLVGAAVSGFSEYKKQKLVYDHDERMVQLKMESDSKKAEYQLKGLEVKTSGEEKKSDAESFKEAIKADKATYSSSSRWLIPVDFVRGLIRPAATIWFSYLGYRVYVDLEDVMDKAGVSLDGDKLLELHSQVTLTLLWLTSVVITYWFGTRIKTQKPINRLFKDE